MPSSMLFLMAGLLGIGGGYLVWIWLRGGRSPWLGLGGFIALALYGIALVLQPSQHFSVGSMRPTALCSSSYPCSGDGTWAGIGPA